MSLKTFHIYSDESRHKTERFLLLSGLWIEELDIDGFETKFQALRKKNGFVNSAGTHVNFLGEFKWIKVSKKYFPVYKELVDIFFEAIDEDVFRFCAMLVDTHNPNVVALSNIKKEGYFKLLYQLYLHNSRIPGTYKIFPDRITNAKQAKFDLHTLDRCLDRAFVQKFTPLINPDDHPGTKGFVHSIIPLDSKKSSFIQIVDVVMGALGYLQNEHFKKVGANEAKVELMKYIFEKIALSGAIKITGKTYFIAKSTKFNIWMFRPKTKIATER